jgi:hypothetical protein
MADFKEILKKNKNFQDVIKISFLELFKEDSFVSRMERFIFRKLTKDELEDINPKKAFAIASMFRKTFMELINLNCLANQLSIYMTDSDEFNELAPEIDEMLQNDSSFMDKLKTKMQSCADNFLEEHDTFSEISPYTLSKNNDKVGDVIDTHGEFSVDLGTRDAPFVFLNGNIEIGREADTHSMLLTRLINNEESSPTYIRGETAFDMTGDNEIAFGHIANNLAFLEVVDNVDVNKVVNELIDLPNIEKVYDYQEYKDELKRLAKLKGLKYGR